MEYGCIGEKLTHSFSKEIHARFFDYDYSLQELSRDELDTFFAKKDFKAINVTIPYKQDVIPYLDWVSSTAKKIGAVNTIVNKNGKLYGYNTDFAGMTALIKFNNIVLKNKKVLILGSGGTSKTAVAVAEYLGASVIKRVSRTSKEDCITYEHMYKSFSDAQVIINTTPCGMYPNIVGEPVNINAFNNLHAVVDAIYNPLCSNLVVKAIQKNIKATGGLYMLVAQAAFAAELFVDTKIDESKIYKVFKKIISTKQNIVLTGMPSSGKSTVAKRLADELNMPFYDSDTEIERLYNATPSDIIKLRGEAAFRDAEATVIKTLSAKQGCIIATGGGSVLKKENIIALKGNGKIYFIDRPLELLLPTSDRPLSSNKTELEKRYKERYKTYCDTADLTVENSGKIEDVINAVKEDFCYENTCN